MHRRIIETHTTESGERSKNLLRTSSDERDAKSYAKEYARIYGIDFGIKNISEHIIPTIDVSIVSLMLLVYKLSEYDKERKQAIIKNAKADKEFLLEVVEELENTKDGGNK